MATGGGERGSLNGGWKLWKFILIKVKQEIK